MNTTEIIANNISKTSQKHLLSIINYYMNIYRRELPNTMTEKQKDEECKLTRKSLLINYGLVYYE